MFHPGIKFVCFDFDGTFTDGQFYVSSNGSHLKAYNDKDSYAIKMLKDRRIKTAMLTDESTVFDYILQINHFNKLDFFQKGSENKIKTLDIWRQQLGLHWSEIAYIGDDLDDLECMSKVGIAGAPFDAVPEILAVSTYKSKYSGGHGAVRDFINYLISQSYLQAY